MTKDEQDALELIALKKYGYDGQDIVNALTAEFGANYDPAKITLDDAVAAVDKFDPDGIAGVDAPPAEHRSR